jgi:hypothetical protein
MKNNEKKQKSIKKKISLSYKLFFSFLIILAISLFYFVILVSTKPMSFPVLSNKVEEILKESFGDDIKIEKTFINFTKYGNIRIVGTNISLFYEVNDKEKKTVQKQVLILPRIEAEFSIIKMFLLKFQPEKILIIDPKITINLAIFTDNEKFNLDNNQGSIDNSKNGDLSAITQFLHKIRKGDILIEKFELQNAHLILIDGDSKNQIYIKQAKIRADSRKKDLTIEAQSFLKINNDENIVNINTECLFFKDSRLQCDSDIKNFAPKSLASFHENLSDLDKIFTKLDGKIKLKMNHKKIKNIEFDFSANQASFYLAKYFSQKIDLNNFKIHGDYDHEIGMLNLSQVEADILSENNKQGIVNPHLSMTLMASNLEDSKLKMDFFIRAQNILQVDLNKFWPISLNQNDVRKWVIEHLSDGIIKNAYSKFTLIGDEKKDFQLSEINSEIIFADMNLNYDSYFPKISNLLGIARFNKNNMEISIASGDVLQSKISNAMVRIDDFNQEIPILKITGNLDGIASDTLKHANYQANFAREVEKYLNGNAQSKFEIHLQLVENINLEKILISANSQISGLKNDFVNGDVNVSVFKDFNSNNFINNLDLTNLQINLEDFDITKNNNIESNIKFNLMINDNSDLLFKNIELYKIEEEKKLRNKKTIISKIYSSIRGDFILDNNSSMIKSLKLENKNFGNNNFNLFYDYDFSKNFTKVMIKGQKFYAGGFLQSKIFSQKNHKKNHKSNLFDNLFLSVNLNRVELLRNKFLRNFNFFLNCKNNLCPSFFISANYDKLDNISLQATKKAKDDYVLIDGRITDIGYLSEGLGISNLIAEGNSKITLKQRNLDNQISIDGKIVIDDDITIFENETVKRFANDNLYSQIKDSIFSSNKTTFNSLKLDFIFHKQIIKINSLIANNFKIGITAKGEINLAKQSYNLNGMIIPGYIVNSLFGIGKIPLIGSVISGILTGGQGGGLFGLRYEYVKKPNDKEGKLTTNKISAFVPSTIQNLFAD